MIRAFYSDPHFNHDKVIPYSDRPFASIEMMNEGLIERYNERIGRSDLVVWCGDAFFGTGESAREIMRRLNGHKILVRGNHDGSASRMLSLGFDVVVDELAVRIGGVTATVSHFPFANSLANGERKGKLDDRFLERRPTPRQGRVLIHGHTHKKARRHDNQIHVGVDAWDYAPALFEEVEKVVLDVGIFRG